MIKIAPVRCNHCSKHEFIVFDYLDNVLVLQCCNCKMVYGHQPDNKSNINYEMVEINLMIDEKGDSHESEL